MTTQALRRRELVEMGKMLLVCLVPVEGGHALNEVYPEPVIYLVVAQIKK
jgi:hypothetical protein